MDEVSGIADQLPLQLCVLGDSLAKDASFLNICKDFQVPVVTSQNAEEFIGRELGVRTVFVHENFSGELFDRLVGAGAHILGPPAIKGLRARGEPLLVKRSPVFCLQLLGCNIVFSGYRRKADVKNMLQKVQWCGGSVNKDTGTKLTQLVAANSMGEKYQYATTFSIPVLTEAWLTYAWSKRMEVESRADSKEVMNKFRLPIFAGNVVQFYGFEASELAHMQEVLVANGGRVASGPVDRTHLVVDENTVEVLPASLEEGVVEGCHLVKGEWFWRSIQIEAAAKVAHHGWRKEQGLLSPNISRNTGLFSPSTPLGVGASASASNKKRKRRRQAEMMVLLAAESPANKRRSSVTDLNNLNMSGSFLDASDPRLLDGPADTAMVMVTPENSPARGAIAASTPAYTFDPSKATARQQVFHEFVTTETNYVAVLRCISKMAEEAEDGNQQGGALLNEQEMKIIFGMLPPILKVHTEMLQKLVAAEENWSENVTVGSIIMQFAEDLLKAYPPFVNFFERTKNQIKECDQKSVRFHAFLKMCERRPESSRQTLPELMIRPVQRLPSISLLLSDLLKHTQRSLPTHPDCQELEKALAKIKEVMTHLNEEKRRTEGQIHIFDIYSEIENCPASVVSSHRSFVSRIDCVEMASENQLCGKGYELTLFLFTDILVVAKRKSNKTLSISRSPSTASLAGAGTLGHGQGLLQTKLACLSGSESPRPSRRLQPSPSPRGGPALKFVQMIQLSSVRRLVDVLDVEECDETGEAASSLVAIVCRLTEDLRERMYVVQLMVDNHEDKLAFLKLICRHVANTRCRPDPEELMAKMAATELGLDSSDLSVTSFSKAISSFNKTKQKVGRAFSFNKTPSKMKRAVSSMMSPRTAPRLLVTESATLGRTPVYTPHQGLRELRLELGDDGAAEGTPVLVSMTASATLTRTQSMSPNCFISPNVSLNVPQSTIGRTDTVSSFCRVSPSVSPSTSPTSMPPPVSLSFKADTVSSFCRISPSVSPVAAQPMTGLEAGEKIGKAGKVLGIPLEPSHGTSARTGGKGVPLGEVTGVKEGYAEGADDQDTPRSSRKGLQSCVNLGDEGGFGSPTRGSFPRRQTKELGQVQESPGAENQNPDFRTPNLCSRPSFRDKLGFRQRAGSLAGFGSKKHQIN